MADDGTVGLFANVGINPEGLVQATARRSPMPRLPLGHDANAAALVRHGRELRLGVPSFVLIAIGTGRCRALLTAKLAAGAFGAGGDWTHYGWFDGAQDGWARSPWSS